MKKSFYLTALAALALMVFSCEQVNPLEPVDGPEEQELTPDEPDQPAGPDAEGNIVFTASREDLGGDLKSTIASGGAVSWESGDAISILWNGGRTTSTTTDSGSEASFSATVDAEAAGGTYYAVYPSSIATELTDTDVLSVTIPSSQDGTFSSANINVAKTTSTSFSFKAVGNVIKFTVTDSDITKVRIYSWDKSALSGICSVDVSEATPAISGEYSSTSSEIEVAIDGAGTYYAVVLPGTHAEGLLFAPETATTYKRAAYADKSWTAARKAITDFGAIQSHARDLYVSASGSGNGLTSLTPMSPEAFTALLEQQSEDDDAQRNFRLLFGSTITIQDDIAIDETRVEFGSAFKKACEFTIAGASAATAISAAGENRLFRFSNNTNVAISGITLTGGSADNGGAIQIANGSTGTATVTCSNVTFSGNVASKNGGAVHLNAYAKAASFVANTCTFTGNHASTNGGAIYQTASNEGNAGNSTMTFTDCTYSGNYTGSSEPGDAGNGGVIQIYRGTATFTDGSVNNAFYNNIAKQGGVFYVSGVGVLKVTGGVFGVAGDSSWAQSNQAKAGNGGGVIYYEAGSVSFNGSLFQYNTSDVNGGVIGCDKSTANDMKFTSCEFSHNKATANGGVAYLTNSAQITFESCNAHHNAAVSGGVAQIYKGTVTVTGGTYNYNEGTGAGGAFYANSSTASLSVTDASFLENVARKGSSKGDDSRESGGALCASNSAVMELTNCYFYGNIAGNTDNTDSKEYGGAICINKASVTATLCNFHRNKGNRGGAVMLNDAGGGLFKADRCSFHENKQYGRGVIYVLDNNVAMFNQCSFYGQELRATSGAWGEQIQTASNTAVCVNNCSFNSTKTSYTKQISAINMGGHLLLTNSTVIGQYSGTASGVIRESTADAICSYANNVIVNRASANSLTWDNSSKATYCEYNVLGATNSSTPSKSNYVGAVASSFTWTPDSGSDDALTLWQSWFTWSGESQGASVTDITDAFDAFSVDASSYGGVLSSMTNVGAAFKSWLDSFSPAAYTINQRGGQRNSSYWPGSYQN